MTWHTDGEAAEIADRLSESVTALGWHSFMGKPS